MWNTTDEKHDAIHRRAYLLFANRKLVAARKKPAFLDTAKVNRAEPIPIGPKPQFQTNGIYAVTSRGDTEFTLYRNGSAVESFDLPVWLQTRTTWGRIGLTPFAVVGDASIIGFVAATIWIRWESPEMYR